MSNIPDPNEPCRVALRRAVEIAGGQAALGRRLGVKQGQVFNWLRFNKRGIPAHHVLAVEKITRVPRYELRPDVYPRPAKQLAQTG